MAASTPSLSKQVYYFDLDQTLIEVVDDKKPFSLSESAELELSQDENGVLYDQLIVKTPSMQITAQKVIAISRERFKQFFKEVQQINSMFGETLIYVNVITNASYTENEMRSILSILFGMQIYFYHNRNRSIEIKQGQMEKDYQSFYAKLGIKRENVILIDDDYQNCSELALSKFTPIHFCTNPYTRLPSDSFSEKKEELFSFLELKLEKLKEQIFSS